MKKNIKDQSPVLVSPDICKTHHIHLTKLPDTIKIAGQEGKTGLKTFCVECVREKIEQETEELTQKGLNDIKNAKTYKTFQRDSYIPESLQKASFENFIANTPEEKLMLDFAKEQTQKYLDGMIGNTIITGDTGIGKTHLTLAMARAINEGYKEKGQPVTVLFISFTELIKKIKAGWNSTKTDRMTEDEAVNLLRSADYLILDDLGTKNATIKARSDWEQDLLFDILDKQKNTIINTNLDSQEMKIVYNSRNYSRILQGAEGNTFKAFGIKDKRYSLNTLRKGTT